jgi:hypothetical protein
MQKAVADDVVRQLLERTRLAGDDLTARLAQARSPAYWQGLNPSLSVGRAEAGGVGEATALGPDAHEAVVEQLRADGYFQIDALLPGPTLARMRDGVEVLRGADWPPVFSFVYDEFWQVTRVPSLVRVLTAALGPGYGQIPHVWTFHVAARAGARGWPPHTDGGSRAGGRSRVVVWVPLSDATLENGCIYVIPRRRIAERIEAAFPTSGSMGGSDVRALLQGCRALPAGPGTVLGWDFNLIHWGSTAGDAGAPRVSLSVEFLGPDAVPASDELPLLDAQSDLPTFEQRLLVIARAVRSDQRFEPLLIRFQELAGRLVGPA